MDAAAPGPQEETSSEAHDESSDEVDDESDASPEGQSALDGQPTAPGKKKRRRRRRKSSIRPPSRHCGFCTQFLAKNKTVELPCASCGTPIFWPPESQLQTELGNWEIPKLCGACKRDATEAERQRAKQEIIDQAPHALGRAGGRDQVADVAEATPVADATITTDVTPTDVAPPTDATEG